MPGPYDMRKGREMRRVSSLVVVAAAFTALVAFAQVKEGPIPRLVKKDGRYALFVDGAPYFILGAQVNNSSGWPGVLPKVWPAMEFMHANTVEIPVYWEQFEPKQGQFDTSVVDTLLTQARAHKLRLILLWFATWKNGNPHYIPEWMKVAPERYARVVDKSGRPADVPSPFAAASREADAKAFTALMRHLKDGGPAAHRADGAGGERARHRGAICAITRRRRRSSSTARFRPIS